MRLSEAIRLGAMLKPQCIGGLVSGDASCALLAGADACGIKPVFDESCGQLIVNYDALEAMFPILLSDATAPDGSYSGRVMACVYILNDSQGWTREQIADWVETIEQAQQAESSIDVVAPVAVGRTT